MTKTELEMTGIHSEQLVHKIIFFIISNGSPKIGSRIPRVFIWCNQIWTTFPYCQQRKKKIKLSELILQILHVA